MATKEERELSRKEEREFIIKKLKEVIEVLKVLREQQPDIFYAVIKSVL